MSYKKVAITFEKNPCIAYVRSDLLTEGLSDLKILSLSDYAISGNRFIKNRNLNIENIVDLNLNIIATSES